jgi:hypothetical protein
MSYYRFIILNSIIMFFSLDDIDQDSKRGNSRSEAIEFKISKSLTRFHNNPDAVYQLENTLNTSLNQAHRSSFGVAIVLNDGGECDLDLERFDGLDLEVAVFINNIYIYAVPINEVPSRRRRKKRRSNSDLVAAFRSEEMMGAKVYRRENS